MAREKRDKIDKSELDLMAPIDITIFGSEEDPCFGKLHEPSNNICGRCGDAEVCAIVQSQRQHIKRGKENETNKFKDQEEPYLELKSLDRFLQDNLKTGKLRYRVIEKKAVKFFCTMDKVEPDRVKEFMLKYVRRSPHYKVTKKEGKRYIAAV